MKLIVPLLASIVVSSGAFDEQKFIEKTLDDLENVCITVMESNEKWLNEKIIKRLTSKELIKNTAIAPSE